jgi:hypothetical protein
LGAPASWFRPTSRSSDGGTRRLSGQVTFLRLSPASEFDPWAARTRRAPLSRGSAPPQRYPSREVYHSRALPTRVTLRPRTYHVPRRLTPSRDSLVSFQPGALAGRGPSELDLTKIISVFRRRLPLLRLATLPRPADNLPTVFAPPRDWPSAGMTHRTGQVRSLSDLWRLPRFRR